jgi:predicted nucleic acid-binding protein
LGWLIDTSLWIAVERGALGAADIAAITRQEPVYLSPVNIAEIQFGLDLLPAGARKQKAAAALRRLRRKPQIRITVETAEVFGAIAAKLKKGAARSECPDQRPVAGRASYSAQLQAPRIQPEGLQGHPWTEDDHPAGRLARIIHEFASRERRARARSGQAQRRPTQAYSTVCRGGRREHGQRWRALGARSSEFMNNPG